MNILSKNMTKFFYCFYLKNAENSDVAVLISAL